MGRLLTDGCDPKELSTAALAFIGDGVYSLLVRERLSCSGHWNADTLHKRAVETVRCDAQSAAAARVLDNLTETERAVYMRGRNTHTSHIPKSAAVSDYRSATGLEALMGYVYLTGDEQRLRELFDLLVP